jgi:hypothetical protein
MPPVHHGYWVILAGMTPTSFRGRNRDALVPTLRQLQRTQKDVTLRWFENGRIYESPEHARAMAMEARRARFAPGPRKPARGPDWRPGGQHKDPRAKYEMTRDQKRARFKRRLRSGPPDRRRKKTDE